MCCSCLLQQPDHPLSTGLKPDEVWQTAPGVAMLAQDLHPRHDAACGSCVVKCLLTIWGRYSNRRVRQQM